MDMPAAEAIRVAAVVLALFSEMPKRVALRSVRTLLARCSETFGLAWLWLGRDRLNDTPRKPRGRND
jgi:hypothetical protein